MRLLPPIRDYPWSALPECWWAEDVLSAGRCKMRAAISADRRSPALRPEPVYVATETWQIANGMGQPIGGSGSQAGADALKKRP